MKGSKNILNLFRSAYYRITHKNYDFPLFGLNLFIGRFGSGKTLSVVDRITSIIDQYPDAFIVSNVNFNIYKDNKNFRFCENESIFIETMLDIYTKYDYHSGVIVLLDEVHSFLIDTLSDTSSVNFKFFFAVLSQLRKLNTLFFMTSQLYGKVPKVLRDYTILNGNIISCKQLIPGLTRYAYYDMEDVKEDSKMHLVGRFKYYGFSLHSPELYQAYDSYAVVASISGLFNKKG